MYVFVQIFGLDRAQNNSCLLRAEEPTSKNVLVT